MKLTKIKAPLLAVLLLGAGLTACNTGTDPGDTNTERSDIKYPAENDRVDPQKQQEQREDEKMEQIYEGREGTAIGDSAYNQEGKRDKRYDKNLKPDPKQ